MKRLALILSALLALSACAVPTQPVNEELLDLGDFQLGHNIVVAPDIQMGPLSREASTEDWIASMKNAVDARFGRYEGSRLVHFGVNIGGYVLAAPGVPLVVSPKSVLIITVTAWDDRAGGKFNKEPREIIVLESLSGSTLIGTGYTMSAEEQMANLTYNAAKAMEKWLYENRACLVDNVPPEVQATCWKKTKDDKGREALELQ